MSFKSPPFCQLKVLVSRWSKPAARNPPRFEKSWNAFPQLKKPPAHHQVDLSDFPVKVKLHQPSQVKEFSHEKLVAIRNAPWDEVQNCDLRPSQGSHLDLTKFKLICRWGGDPSIQLEVCQQAQVAKLLTCPVHMLTPYLCMYKYLGNHINVKFTWKLCGSSNNPDYENFHKQNHTQREICHTISGDYQH